MSDYKPRVIGILQYSDGTAKIHQNPIAPRHVQVDGSPLRGPTKSRYFLSEGMTKHRTGTLVWLFREVTKTEFDADTERLRRDGVIP